MERLILVDVSTFGAETWQVERDGELVPGEHGFRENAILAAWADASQRGRVTGSQSLAVVSRPPPGYAVALVAGTTQGPTRLGSWDEMREAQSKRVSAVDAARLAGMVRAYGLDAVLDAARSEHERLAEASR